jgi:hypothetical protein
MPHNGVKKVRLSYMAVIIFFSFFCSCQYFNVDVVETDFSPTTASGLSAIHINTDNRKINSTDHWLENAKYSIQDESGTLILNGYLDIKGRGNSTWKMPKKPYSIKLSENTELFGLPANRRWVLLANYADKTLLRTEVAYKLGSIFDNLSWTPHSVQLDLYLNGKYRGVYQLTEAIRINEKRVNIEKINSSNPQNGYILEADWRRGELFNFTTRMGVVFCCSDPDEDLDQIIVGDTISLFQKIITDFQNVEDVLYSSGFKDRYLGYRKYLDIPSIIDWYFVNEITKNVDSQFGLSVYLYYDNVKQKYCMGPIWDFDYAIGNVNYADSRYSTGFWVKNSYWISRLFEDPYFVAAVKERWSEKKNEVNTIFSFINDRASYLDRAQAFNFKKWTILDKQIASGAYIVGDYQIQIDTISSWLTERLDWLDTEINKM